MSGFVQSGRFTSSFTPASLSPDAWYDASDAASITSSGGLVTQWNDLSGNARHGTAAAAARPTTGSATMNGLNVLVFDGNATVLTVASSTMAPKTVFVVAKSTGTPRVQGHLYRHGYSTAFIIRHNGTGQNALLALSSGTILSVSSVTGLTSAHYLTAQNNGSALTIRKNGAQAGTTAAAAQGSITDVAYIGGVPVGINEFFTGQIAEIVVFATSLATADRDSMESYLAAKWAI